MAEGISRIKKKPLVRLDYNPLSQVYEQPTGICYNLPYLDYEPQRKKRNNKRKIPKLPPDDGDEGA
jgi:hypothetical protein